VKDPYIEYLIIHIFFVYKVKRGPSNHSAEWHVMGGCLYIHTYIHSQWCHARNKVYCI